VTSRTAAVRYARALFDVLSRERGDLTAVERELDQFVALFAAHPELQKVMVNPAVPAPRKRAAVTELANRARLQPVLAKLMALLAERDRLALLPDVLRSFRERVLDHQNVVRAELTTAMPLAPERVSQIQRGLSQVTGRTVMLESRVDPALVGGLIARVGSVVYDASITTQLRKMKDRLEQR